MLESKNKRINICIEPCKKIPDLAVLISFKYECSTSCLKKLKYNAPALEPKLSKDSDESALVYSLVECIKEKLTGNPLEMLKSKVSSMKCWQLNKQFMISFKCQGTGSALRKVLSVSLSCMAPQKLFSKYSENIRFLGGVPNKKHFLYAVDKLNQGLEQINICAVGKININSEKLNNLTSSISKKLPELMKVKKSDMEHPEERECVGKMYPVVKANSLESLFIADYIRSNSGGMGVELHDGVVEVYNDKWDSKRKQLSDKKRISDYVDKKYSKLVNNNLECVVNYYGISSSYVDYNISKKLMKMKLNLSDIKKMIKL